MNSVICSTETILRKCADPPSFTLGMMHVHNKLVDPLPTDPKKDWGILFRSLRIHKAFWRTNTYIIPFSIF